MLQVSKEYKIKVLAKLLEVRKNFDGTDSNFAKSYGIHNSVFSRLKANEIDGLLKDAQWIHIGMKLNVSQDDREWYMARTEVFSMIEEDILFCKQYSKSKMCISEAGIGKTFAGKYLAMTLKNVFYIDASQAKTKQIFIQALANAIGVESGKYHETKEKIKYYLKVLPKPLVIIDEAGDLQYEAFLEIKEFWNATENHCGWYLMAADGLEAKMNRGIKNKKVGYREIFSRFSENFTNPVPNGVQDKLEFYTRLFTDVLRVNMKDKKNINEIVNKSLVKLDDGNSFAGLRRVESLVILTQDYDEDTKHK
ncbi:MAG: AAA family ATPase [Flectobacillus sp.]|uniref:AAA family ATPase n=1 Tax=Flectobacillus sp. TaxID=50419 RepID=UPI003B9A9414